MPCYCSGVVELRGKLDSIAVTEAGQNDSPEVGERMAVGKEIFQMMLLLPIFNFVKRTASET